MDRQIVVLKQRKVFSTAIAIMVTLGGYRSQPLDTLDLQCIGGTKYSLVTSLNV